jgi:archaellum biogenesis protein FlaJ (TadC family)
MFENCLLIVYKQAGTDTRCSSRKVERLHFSKEIYRIALVVAMWFFVSGLILSILYGGPPVDMVLRNQQLQSTTVMTILVYAVRMENGQRE